MTRFSRSNWKARPAKGLVRLDRRNVVGLALHWPAMTHPLTTVDAVKAALRGWQNYHMDGRDWADIAYQEAIDQQGNTYRLRGLRFRSAANGDEDTNSRYGALLLVLAPGEKPTLAMVDAVRRRVHRHQLLFPRSTQIVGHGDIRPEPTACPGPATQALIASGAFDPRKVKK